MLQQTHLVTTFMSQNKLTNQTLAKAFEHGPSGQREAREMELDKVVTKRKKKEGKGKGGNYTPLHPTPPGQPSFAVKLFTLISV